ncbi:MAG: hypothetical protein JWM11_2132 [Planctomycetaceae bacterium]|nr:hypothetical protein [Planctomycetaceae bacterium]
MTGKFLVADRGLGFTEVRSYSQSWHAKHGRFHAGSSSNGRKSLVRPWIRSTCGSMLQYPARPVVESRALFLEMFLKIVEQGQFGFFGVSPFEAMSGPLKRQ